MKIYDMALEKANEAGVDFVLDYTAELSSEIRRDLLRKT